MDGIKVTALDRFRYRAVLKLRNWMYEASVGLRLRNGDLPASITTIQSFFGRGPVGGLLPYEAFGDDGIFLNEGSYGFVIALTRQGRLGLEQGQALAREILEALPPTCFAQFQYFNTGREAQAYDCLLAVTLVKSQEGRALLGAARVRVAAILRDHHCSCEQWGPEQLLDLLQRYFNQSGQDYDDTLLIKHQVGRATMSVTPACLTLHKQDGVATETYHVFTVRRFAFRRGDPVPMGQLAPPLVGPVPAHLSFNLIRVEGEETVGQVAYIGLGPSDNGDYRWRDLFSRMGWLIEQDKYSTHLTWLSALPMGLDAEVASALKQCRRTRPFPVDHLSRTLPMPYVANRAGPVPATPSLDKGHAYA